MKLFILFIFLPIHAWSISPSDVCKNVASKSVGEALRCNQWISEDYFFDNSAVFGCHKMSHWTAKGAVDCMVAISDRIYPNQTAKTCVELAGYHFKAIECFQTSGREYLEEQPCENKWSLLNKLHIAKDNILNRRYQSAYQVLTDMENELLNCSVEE